MQVTEKKPACGICIALDKEPDLNRIMKKHH